jgi:hypothetical protein
VVNDDGLVDLEGYGLKLTMWNHDPDRLRDAVHYRGGGAGAEIAGAGCARALRLLIQLGRVGRTTPCHPGARQAPGESTADFLARAMREDHGLMVPGRSLLAPDVVEGQE